MKKEKLTASLWVYYIVWTKEMDKLVKKFTCEGGGCCTHGYADSSFQVKDLEKAKKAAKALTKVDGVGWTEVFVHDYWNPKNKKLYFLSRKISPQAKRMILAEKKRVAKRLG